MEEICFYCGLEIVSKPINAYPLQKHIDHFYPKSKGGSNDPRNLVPSCMSCNLEKRAMTPGEWRNHCFTQAYLAIRMLRWLIGKSPVQRIDDLINTYDLKVPALQKVAFGKPE